MIIFPIVKSFVRNNLWDMCKVNGDGEHAVQMPKQCYASFNLYTFIHAH